MFDYSVFGGRTVCDGTESCSEVTRFEGEVDDADWIGLATFRLLPIESNGRDTEMAPLARAVIEPIEVMRGISKDVAEWTDNDGSSVVLVADTLRGADSWSTALGSPADQTAWRLAAQAFSVSCWDVLPKGVPVSNWPGSVRNSCSDLKVPVIVEDQTYLVMRRSGNVRIVEPVTGPEAQLVSFVRKRIESKANRIGADLTAEAFFRAVDAAIVLESGPCSEALINAKADLSVLSDKGSAPVRSDPAALTLQPVTPPFGAKQADLALWQIHWASLLDYFAQTSGQTDAISCGSGQRFLMFYMSSAPAPESAAPGLTSRGDTYLPRFARIEDGRVRIEDILTDARLVWPRPVRLEDVQDWVGKGAFDP